MKKFLALIWIVVSVLFSASHASPRVDSLLDSGWRFKLGEIAGADQPRFDDHDWQTVALPPNWGWEQAQKGEDYYRGPGWYRHALDLGSPKPGKRYFLRFEAAGSVADIYLN